MLDVVLLLVAGLSLVAVISSSSTITLVPQVILYLPAT